MRKRTHGRECALKFLYQYEVSSEPEHGDLFFEAFWEHVGQCEDDVKAFTEDLVRGTLSHLDQINVIIDKYTENWHLNRMASIDRSILRCATYELLFCSDIPPKVTINEAVNLAKKFSQENSGKFVNGVLDKISHSEKL